MGFKLKKWIFISIIFLSLFSQAEYRVFRLKITDAKGLQRQFLSTLDPEQHVGYFPLRPTEKISYTETWMCKGRTGDFQPFCANPRQPPPSSPQL